MLPFPAFDHIQALQGTDDILRLDTCHNTQSSDLDIILCRLIAQQSQEHMGPITNSDTISYPDHSRASRANQVSPLSY